MAYNQNGQAYPGHYNPYQNQQPNDSQNQYYSHTYPQQFPQPPARRSSFEAGDDGTYADGRGGNNRAGSGPSGHIRMPDHSQFMSGTGSVHRHQSGNSGGYPSQASPDLQSSQYSHVPYNPQEYARAEPQYNTQSYSTPPLNSSANMSYQPYNPAAYHPTSPQASNQAYPPYSPSNYFAPTFQNNSIQHNSQPSVRMPYETDYGQRPQPSISPYQSQQATYGSHSSVPPPQVGSPSSTYQVYTPPAPPPPPTSSNPYATQPGSTAIPYANHVHSDTSIPQRDPTPHATHHTRGSSTTSYNQQDYYGTGDYATSASAATHNSTDPRPRRQAIADQGSPQRSNTSGRHPQARPLPGPPSDAGDHGKAPEVEQTHQNSGIEDLLDEIEAAVSSRTPTTSYRESSPRSQRHFRKESILEEEEPQPLHINTESRRSQGNGAAPPSSSIDVNYGAYSDDSDAEAAAGLAAMQLAEEQEAADQARRSDDSRFGHNRQSSRANNPLPVPPKDEIGSSDSDVPFDMASYGGGFPPHYNYGTPTGQSHLEAQADVQRQGSKSTQRSDLSSDTLAMSSREYYPGEETIHPFPAFGARTDTGGTGGLSEPGQERRLSFEDGDEETLIDTLDHASSGATSPARESIRSRSSLQDSKHQHSRTNSRPLPQIPRRGAVDYQTSQRQLDQYGRPIYPQAPDEYAHTHQLGPSAVQKANSVGSHSHTPVVVPPGRSVTDAEQRRRAQMGGGVRASVYDSQLSPDSAGNNYAEMILPTIPAGKRRKFVPSKLSTSDYKKCLEPWAQSAILAWIRDMTEGETDLRKSAITEGLVALFTHKVPTMNTADAEVLSARLVDQMLDEGALLRDEEWVKFGTNQMTGVIYQLTGTGCYSSRLHATPTPGRCYSHHCMRTLRKVNLKTQDLTPQRKVEDWATFYGLKKEDVASVTKKEIEKQNNLHEVVTSEDFYMDQLNVLRVLYRDGLFNSPDILSAKRRGNFIAEVFGKVDAVKQANEDFLLAQLKYRQAEQGPWVKGFSDIFREWIRKARTAYIEYAANFPTASLKVRKEAERNVLFRQFLDQVRENELSKRLGWDTYLKAPITRLQRYSLLLQTVHKHMEGESSEKTNLDKAIEEIKTVTLECDSKVAEMSKQTDLTDLQGKLRLRAGMENVKLNLTQRGREIVFRGDLQRKGTNKVSWVDTHAILFDHYLVLAKSIQQRDEAGGLKHEVYDVSKLPIPMDLLVLESTSDEAVVKSSVKGIASVSRAQTPQEARLGRVTTANSGGPGARPGIQHANTETSTLSSGSSRTLVTSTVLDSQNDRIMYPFRIRHLGKAETYVLYAPTAQSRNDWCDKIIEARTRHAASLFAQNAEPFRLRVMADTAFNYDSSAVSTMSIVIKGTPLDRAIEECDRSFYGTGEARPGPICRSIVNCATTFNQPYGKRMVAVGTDFGVFVSEYDKPRGWTKVAAIVASHVTQIDVLEEFSIFLVIADKSLVAYHLDSVCPVSGGGGSGSDSRRAPQKLSGNRDIGFFATGRMKDRTLVFYKKREGISSTFKVLEPVYQKSSTSSKSRFGFRKGTTDFFRDFDDFYIPSETYAINLFHSSLAVSSARGIEVLTLDKKVTFSIPDLKAPHVQNIAQRIQGQKPLGMFRLSDNEFLLVFEEVGIYVDKHGDVSRGVVMEFVGRARQATLYNNTYLVLVDAGGGFVEVRNAVNGRLRQVVSGKDVRLLDDGTRGGTVKICLQHPERERVQLVVEMLVNEGSED